MGMTSRAADPGYRFNYDWFSGNIPVWRQYLAAHVGRSNLTFLEVGSWEGRSAVWLLENILTGEACTLHCVDIWASPNGPSVEANFNFNAGIAQLRSKAKIVKHRAKSADMLPKFDARSVDFVYVDGSHVARDVLTDIILAWRLLRVGGILICDDYELTQGIEFHEGYESYPIVPPLDRPKMAIDAFMQCFENTYRVVHKAWQVIIEKRAE